jgi:hypothetical protein
MENLVARARQLGIAPMLIDLLADSTQPEPARHRALVYIKSALVHLGCGAGVEGCFDRRPLPSS